MECDLVARIRFCNVFLWSVQDGEVDPQLVFFTDEACFHYVERCILRPISIGVQKVQDLFTNSLFVMKKLVFGVQCMPAVRLQLLGKNSRE
jgi:hypothetical protein